MMAEAAEAPDDQKPSQEALERLLHTGLVPATVAACWDGARAKLAGGGAEARRAREHVRHVSRKQTSHIPLKLFRDLISDGGLTADPQFLNPRAWGSSRP